MSKYSQTHPSLRNIFVGFLIPLFIVVSIQIFSSADNVSAQGIDRFSSDFTILKSRVSRLENEVRRLTQSVRQGERLSENNPSPAPILAEPIGPSDPMFARLATLVIELKERIQELEAKVAQLESQQ